MNVTMQMSALLVLLAVGAHGVFLRRESPPVPVTGPDGCPPVKPMCAEANSNTGTFHQWEPTCEGGKWMCYTPVSPLPPPEPVEPCIIEPPVDPSGCPLMKPGCMSIPEGGGPAVMFEPTCQETADGTKKWLCEEPNGEIPGLPKVCCKAFSAKCLACAAGQTEEQYCDEKPGTAGCPEGAAAPPACCLAMNAQCLACAAGQTVEEYCGDDPFAVGCPKDTDAREYAFVKSNKRCGAKGYPRLTKHAESVDECAALAADAGYGAFLIGLKGFKKGRCVGVKLEVTTSMWSAYKNSKMMPQCPMGWVKANKFEFYVLEPKK